VTSAAADALRRGEVVGLPTDTVYSLAVCLAIPGAVERMFEVMGIPAGAPVAVLVSSIEQAAEIATLDVRAWALAAAHWPGPLALVARPAGRLSPSAGDRGRTVAVRMPDHEVALDLITEVGPLAVSPAGMGDAAAGSATEARSVFGGSVALYLPGSCPGVGQLTVVDVTGTRFIVLRAGAVTFE
jgi:tRNA threonylcarbamoyl adenosine modification protein (Sua5/YciO/YrdC/YwlC family)